MRFQRLPLCLLLSTFVFIGLSACSQPPADEPVAETNDPAPAETTPAPAEDEVPKNTIRWRTASEVDNFGFDVYRGDTEEGPFTRITESPIAGAGTTDAPSDYVYVDDTIDPERVYWYYVESISMSNAREKFTPTFCAKPKVGPNLCEAPEGDAEAEGTESS